MRTAIHRVDAPDTHVAVAARIDRMLREERWTGRSAARTLGWSVPYMSRRLNGEIPFDVADVLSVAALLKVSPAEFFEGIEEPTRNPEVAGWGQVRHIRSAPSYAETQTPLQGGERLSHFPVVVLDARRAGSAA